MDPNEIHHIEHLERIYLALGGIVIGIILTLIAVWMGHHIGWKP